MPVRRHLDGQRSISPTDSAWSIDDKLLGDRVSYTGTLQSERHGYTHSSLDAITLPGVWRRADYRDASCAPISTASVYEGAFAANNDDGVRPPRSSVAVPTLTIGSPRSLRRCCPGQQRLYQVVVPEGETLRLTLTAGGQRAVGQRPVHPLWRRADQRAEFRRDV